MSDHSPKDKAIVYPTLWKKTMIFGVPRDYALVCMLGSAPLMVLSRIVVNPPWNMVIAAGVFFTLYVIGAVYARIDPDFFSVKMAKLKLGSTRGDYKGARYVP